MNQTLLTIAVVCFNAKGMIEKTISSLLSQDFHKCEVLFVDGKSSDGTLDLIHNFMELGVYNCRLYSEKDKGIYDAMNKAARLAQGQYIYYLNCGDIFYETNTLSKLIERLNGKGIYYGNMICGEELTISPSKLSNLFFLREHMINHQSIIAKTGLIIDYPFDISLKYTADRDWLLHCYKKKVSYQHIDIIVGYYDSNGASSNKEKLRQDLEAFIYKNYGRLGLVFIKVKRTIRKKNHAC